VSDVINLAEYILLYLADGKPARMPSIHFWAETLLIINAGLQIMVQMEECADPIALEPQDCFDEIADLLEGE
jgi:hypothetical protein